MLDLQTLEIRPEQPADYEAIAQVNILAFGQVNEAQLVERIRASDRYIPDLALVATLESAVVGYALFSYADLVGATTLPVLALAPVAVLPQYQKKGIGTQLIQTGLALAENRAELLVLVLGHPEFYPRFGFEPTVRYGIQCPFPVPEEVFMVKRLKHYQEHYQGLVVYPPAFDAV